MVNGLPNQTWERVDDIIDPYLGVPGEMMCRIDLTFQRPGKDEPMPVTAGRRPDRVGLMFCSNTDQILAGDRIRCLDGPIQGTFELRAMPDVVAGMRFAHHMEVQIVEVSQNMKPNLLNRTEPL